MHEDSMARNTADRDAIIVFLQTHRNACVPLSYCSSYSAKEQIQNVRTALVGLELYTE